jgi:hypothetical protein
MNTTVNEKKKFQVNCTEIDFVLEKIATFHHTYDEDWMSLILPITLSFISFTFLITGFYTFKPLMAVGGSLASFVAVYTMLDNLVCETKLLITAVCSLCVLFLILCLLKFGLFVIGAAAFAATTHYVYETIPESTFPEDIPTFQNRSIIYWISMLLGIIVGAVTVHFGKDQVIIIVTSLLGGFGVSVSISMMVSEDLSPWVWIAMAGILTIIGIVAQFKIKKKVEDKKKKPRHVISY